MAALSKFDLVDYDIVKYIHGKMCHVSPVTSTSKSDSRKSRAMSGIFKGITQAQ